MAFTIRPYEPDEADALYSLKRGFELGLGSGTGEADKQERYENKLTEEYRREYLAWVDRCTDENPRSVIVAARERTEERSAEERNTIERDDAADPELIGYAFVLPASLAYIWDAAVLNEIYVLPEWRGSGVADELMREAIETAREQPLPLDRMVLDVDRDNERAGAFYDRYGFEHWGEMIAREL